MQLETESKRLRSSSDRNVCLIVECWSQKLEYKFYIMDLRDSYGDEFVRIKPNLLFKANCAAVSFCALNSTLYMFEGDFLRLRSKGKFAGKFEISPDMLDYELDRDKDLVPIGPMREKKYSPVALPIPDGKHILVFSSAFSWAKDVDDIYGDSFELYNVADNSWTLCDPLPRSSMYVLSRDLDIVAYGFEGRSHFVIRTRGGLVFALNLKSREWEKTGLNYGVKSHFIGIDDGFRFTPTTAYDNRGSRGFLLQPPLSVFPDSDEDDVVDTIIEPYGIYPYMALLGYHESDGGGGGVYDLGVVQASRPPLRIDCLNVILDVYSVNISEFKRDAEQHKRDAEKHFEKYKEKYKGRWRYDREHEEQKPLFKTNIPTKTHKRRIDFDFDTYDSGQVWLFPI